ncbi:MAG: hypothetical protein IKT63_03565, partial [Oscillospiraceae bacterium]|nr:hypothetical protein [Oscillospiraceae bacterium]
TEIAYMLNEYILYEKYLQVLEEVGETKLTRAHSKIVSDGMHNFNVKGGQIAPEIEAKVKETVESFDIMVEQQKIINRINEEKALEKMAAQEARKEEKAAAKEAKKAEKAAAKEAAKLAAEAEETAE